MSQNRRGRTTVRGVKRRMPVFSAEMNRKRSMSERIADFLTDSFGTIAFFTLNAVVFLAWIIANSHVIPGFAPFDPYPYGMLTMVVSLEAIFLSIIVLVSQNRAAKIADLREELDFQVNVTAEQEITQILRMIERVEKKLLVKELDVKDLSRMKEVLDLVDLEKSVVKELER
ncbi:MAG: DUF1003 domain-containing protein [Patescibacteria group bacterium]